MAIQFHKLGEVLLKAFNIEEEERKPVFLLIAYTLFTGMALSAFYAVSNSLFVKELGVVYLPHTYLVAGIIGFFIFRLYGWLQGNLAFKMLLTRSLVAMGGLLLLFFLVYAFAGSHNKTIQALMAFSTFVFLQPFFAFAALLYGGLTMKLFNFGQTKRLYAIANLGDVLGSILAYVLVSTTSKLFHSYWFYLFSGVCMAISLTYFFKIEKFISASSSSATPQKKESEPQVKKKSLLSSDFIFWCAVITIISSSVAFLSNYSFLGSLKLMSKKIDIAQFISLFYAAVKLGEFTLSLSSGKMISKYGLKLSLMILPALLFVLAGVSVFHYTVFSDFFFFFGFSVLIRFIERIVRTAFENPSYRILLEPLNPTLKWRAQTFISGTVKQSGTLIAGLILLGFAAFTMHIHKEQSYYFFQIFFFAVCVAWVAGAWILYQKYKSQLNLFLANRKSAVVKKSDPNFALDLLVESIYHTNPKIYVNSIAIIAATNPYLLESHLEYILSKDELIQQMVLSKLDFTFSNSISAQVKNIAKNGNDITKQLAQKALQELVPFEFETITKKDIAHFKDATDLETRLLLAKYLFFKPVSKKDLELLDFLIWDERMVINQLGIRLTDYRKPASLMQKLGELLLTSKNFNQVIPVLASYGNKVLPYFDQVAKNKPTTQNLLRIAAVCAAIDSPEAQHFLFSQIRFPNTSVQNAIIKSLHASGFMAADDEAPEIRILIQIQIEYIYWLYAALHDIDNKKNTAKVFSSLEEELAVNYDTLYMLLSFIFEPESINLVRSYSNTSEWIFAAEVIEHYLTQDFKKMIAPLVEASHLGHRLKQINKIYPQEQLKLADRLKDMINKDYNKVNFVSKIKAIDLLGKLKLDPIPNEIVSGLFNTNELLFYSAASTLKHYPKELANKLENRVPLYNKKLFNSIFTETQHDSISYKISVLKKVPFFYILSEFQLVRFASIISIVEYKADVHFNYKNSASDVEILIVLNGELEIENGYGQLNHLTRAEMLIPGVTMIAPIISISAKVDSKIFKADVKDFFNLIVSDINLLKSLYDFGFLPSKMYA